MSISQYLSISLSLSTAIIENSALENVTINGLTNTATPTVLFNTFEDVSASASIYPTSISKTIPSSNSIAPDEILIGEYKSNKDELQMLECEAGKF